MSLDDVDWTRERIKVSGHNVMTYSAGSGERTLLLIHGGPGCPSRYLRESHAVLARDGVRLVTWDQLGCGESDRPVDPALWRLDRFVDEVETVRASLGLEDVLLLGQSWGGVLGLEYLLTYPKHVSALIAADTAFDLPAMQRGFERRKHNLGEETCRMMARHESMGTTSHPEYQAAVTLLMYRHVCRLPQWPDSLVWCLENLGAEPFAAMFGRHFFQCSGNIRDWNRMAALGDLTLPVLLIHGEHDYIDPDLAARARDLLPASELAFFEGCSHMPFFERPDLYFDVLRGFLRHDQTTQRVSR